MELFRVAGLSSEDLMQKGGTNAKAFLGTMFKMAPNHAQQVADAQAAQDALLDEGEDDAGDGEPAEQKLDDSAWTEKDLKAMTKDKLVELAASLGVADVSGTKDKLIEAILGVQ